jgi:flagellar protein FlgJ
MERPMPSYTQYTKGEFIALIAPIVQRVRREGGALLPSVSIAQSWLETGGRVPSWYNMAGYKVGSGKTTPYWDGSSVNTATKEVYNGVTVRTSANWRAYKSIYDFYKDQDLLFDNPRYARVLAARTPLEQAHALHDCGYATDPQYADKIIAIIAANGLTKYDEPAVGKVEDLQLSNYQWGVLEANIKALLDKKVITDQIWLDKVKTRTLTTSELAWLTFVVSMR